MTLNRSPWTVYTILWCMRQKAPITPSMSDIGAERRILEVPAPVKAPAQAPAQSPEPTREPEKVPV